MVDAVARTQLAAEGGVLIEKVADRAVFPCRVGDLVQRQREGRVEVAIDPAARHNLVVAGSGSGGVLLISRTSTAGTGTRTRTRTSTTGTRPLHQLLDLFGFIPENRILSIPRTRLSIDQTISAFGKRLVALNAITISLPKPIGRNRARTRSDSGEAGLSYLDLPPATQVASCARFSPIHHDHPCPAVVQSNSINQIQNMVPRPVNSFLLFRLTRRFLLYRLLGLPRLAERGIFVCLE